MLNISNTFFKKMNKSGVIETKEDEIDGSIKANSANASTKKWLQIRRNGNEREINLFVVVETFRFIFYLWFLLVMIVGILLTLTLSYEPEYKKIIRKLFGSINVCVFFDYPPATYVLPSLYAVWPVIVFQYAILSIFRAWISCSIGSKNSICLHDSSSYHHLLKCLQFSWLDDYS